MRTLVIGTGNPNKLLEIVPHLRGSDFMPVTASTYGKFNPDETGLTLEANAIIKAKAACELSGEWSIADDTGLFVDALNGAPGVWSARYAGPGCAPADNVRKLLSEMSGVPEESRTATFACVIALCVPGQEPITFDGACGGSIIAELRGGNGFGYDPIFKVSGYGKTFAELPEETKNVISHRGIAMAKLRKYLETTGN
jgi:XTP/dITP diphosphohydrolase